MERRREVCNLGQVDKSPSYSVIAFILDDAYS